MGRTISPTWSQHGHCNPTRPRGLSFPIWICICLHTFLYTLPWTCLASNQIRKTHYFCVIENFTYLGMQTLKQGFSSCGPSAKSDQPSLNVCPFLSFKIEGICVYMAPLGMMLFTKSYMYIEWKCIDTISWNVGMGICSFKVLYRIKYKKIDALLIQCPFKLFLVLHGLPGNIIENLHWTKTEIF